MPVTNNKQRDARRDHETKINVVIPPEPATKTLARAVSGAEHEAEEDHIQDHDLYKLDDNYERDQQTEQLQN
jgi:hypothetical protein